ncbi:peptide ABC transporter substrate-binding protein [Microbacterium sorbitolivorans]|uniref:ABC transporter substrate-binding protein n=1 Tax=Microbacterium sorbitolivorans TaxID=1867410 RepID=A0A367XUA1_9MICO|nr:ABC transporter substrate-binding protein [Microbacterium sorbitolivorans]RCK57205.1 ABC transporter substrate-binding protein [Microbacterium sorbitolivorans]GGF45786.1 peptide ABC transporter substrate-binding protein [Microbacterium sorbitolivorans]
MPLVRRLAAPALLAAGLALASCTAAPPDPPEGGPEAPPPGTTVNEDATITVGTLHVAEDLADPADPGSAEALTGNVYESLFRLAETGEAVPLLASGFTRSEDGLVYTIALQPDATFSDGSPLAAADVVDSLVPLIGDGSEVAAVTAVDDDVEITLARPLVSLPHTLAGVWIRHDDLGTGPYTIGEFSSGTSLSLERRDDYWQDPAKNARVDFRAYPAAADLVAALRGGEIDIAPAMAPPADDPAGDGIVVSEAASTTRVLLAFNDSVAPFDDPRVRRALSSAIDDDAVREALWGDEGTPISSMALPSEPWHEDLSALDPFEPDAVPALLTEAGLAEPVTAPILVTDGPLADAADLIAEQLNDAGIEATVERITAAEWRDRVESRRDFTLALGTVSGDHRVAGLGDPRYWWGYRNPDVLGWAEQAESLSNEAEQAELLRLIDLTAANEAASEWLFLEPRIMIASEDVAGYPLAGPFVLAGIERSE